MCNGNLATQICEGEQCDWREALTALEHFGYFLATSTFTDKVFCR